MSSDDAFGGEATAERPTRQGTSSSDSTVNVVDVVMATTTSADSADKTADEAAAYKSTDENDVEVKKERREEWEEGGQEGGDTQEQHFGYGDANNAVSGQVRASDESADVSTTVSRRNGDRNNDRGVSTFALYKAMSEKEQAAPSSPWRGAPAVPYVTPGIASSTRPVYASQAPTIPRPPPPPPHFPPNLPPALSHPLAPPLTEADASSPYYDWWSCYYARYYQIMSYSAAPGTVPPHPPNPWMLSNLPLPPGAIESVSHLPPVAAAAWDETPPPKRRKLAAVPPNAAHYEAFAVPEQQEARGESKSPPSSGPTAAGMPPRY